MRPHSADLAGELHHPRFHRHPPGPHPHAAAPVKGPARTAWHGGRDPRAATPCIEAAGARARSRPIKPQAARVAAAPGNLLQNLRAQPSRTRRAGALAPRTPDAGLEAIVILCHHRGYGEKGPRTSSISRESHALLRLCEQTVPVFWLSGDRPSPAKRMCRQRLGRADATKRAGLYLAAIS